MGWGFIISYELQEPSGPRRVCFDIRAGVSGGGDFLCLLVIFFFRLAASFLKRSETETVG
jgi:hypothetical protein